MPPFHAVDWLNSKNHSGANMTELAERPSTPTGKHNVLGTRPIRHDGMDKVTGRAKFGADVHLPGMLHAKVLRSLHGHARLISVDTSKAEASPGVRAIVTADDLPITDDTVIDLTETLANSRMVAANVLAAEKVLYVGHAIAVVAADSAAEAEDEVKLIDVKYEVLPVVLSATDAMRADAPLLHDSMTTHASSKRWDPGTDTGVQSNVASHLQFKRGDIDAGFAEADIVVEREVTTSTVHQGYIEPHTSTVLWSGDGNITVWTSTQGAFGIRSQVAAILDVPESSVKVVPMEIGGGFGGKMSTYLDTVCALLSKATGRPVKGTMSRKEVLIGSGPTSAAKIRTKIGAKSDGTITAAHLDMAYEAGAFPGSPVGAGANTGLAPYKIENIVVDGYDVVVNKPKVAAYRAPGSPQAAFAIETVLDELAQKLDLDPMELRRRNAAGEGDPMPSGVPLPVTGIAEVQAAVLVHPHYSAPIEGPNRGRGVAMGFWGNAGNSSSASLSVNGDGTVNIVTGSVDIGGTRTSVAMQTAEVLGITAEEMVPSVGDTASIGWTGNTGGSRTTFSTGIAAIEAAGMIVEEMKVRAALVLETDFEDITHEEGGFRTADGREKTFKELASRMLRTGGPITASASSNPRQVGPAVGGHIVDVEVDPETGKVDILRYTVVQDVGLAAHPSYVEGQLQGGAVQGIGWALNEEYVYRDDGTLENGSLLDYRMPTALDVPSIDTVLVEVAAPGHPFGIRGVGEVPIVPPMAAIANAIHDATGVRMLHLPMSPGSVLEALEEAGD